MAGIGDGSRHRYERSRPARPQVAVDTVLFSVRDSALKAYLVELGRGPLRGRWAFPGGLVRVGETLDEAAHRELDAAAGLSDAYLEQLFSFGDPSRDPRCHVVSVAYMALMPNVERAIAPSAKYSRGDWFLVSALPPLAYDHLLMADYAVKRLQAKLEYTNIAYSLLPESFSFAELEHLYGVILSRPIDRRNFRRRIMAMGLLRELSSKRRGSHRPATLYSFVHRSPRVIQML